MFRLLGFLTGVLLTASAILLLLGPDAAQRLEQEISSLLAQSGITGVSAQHPAPAHEQLDLSGPTESAPVPPEANQSRSPAAYSDTSTTVSAVEEPGTTVDFTEPGSASGSNSQQTLFWQPFRSQYAAGGFAARLQRATGVDVEVVQLAPGDVRVALRHQDEEQKQLLVARIESITGLDISASME